jgi:hypothetical protein
MNLLALPNETVNKTAKKRRYLYNRDGWRSEEEEETDFQ